ncbi:hypothetical protein [Promicromonospora soli]
MLDEHRTDDISDVIIHTPVVSIESAPERPSFVDDKRHVGALADRGDRSADALSISGAPVRICTTRGLTAVDPKDLTAIVGSHRETRVLRKKCSDRRDQEVTSRAQLAQSAPRIIEGST